MSEGSETATTLELLPWQEEAWQHVARMREQGRYPHALLLTGPLGIGKVQFAQRLAAALVCEDPDTGNQPCGECHSCRLVRAGTHPDLAWIVPEEEGKAIKVDAVRELIRRSALTTQAKGLRVFLISPAESMNKAAANALLKTLEEPVPSTALILVSSLPHHLPATILSRCQKINFRPVSVSQGADWLKKEGLGDDVEAGLSLAGGAPLLARQFSREGKVQEIGALLSGLIDLKLRKTNPVTVAAEWNGLGTVKVLDGLKRILSESVRFTTTRNTHMLPAGTHGNLQVLMENINLQRIFEFMDELYHLERKLKNNLNSQMVTQKLVNSWLQTTRREKD